MAFFTVLFFNAVAALVAATPLEKRQDPTNCDVSCYYVQSVAQSCASAGGNQVPCLCRAPDFSIYGNTCVSPSCNGGAVFSVQGVANLQNALQQCVVLANQPSSLVSGTAGFSVQGITALSSISRASFSVPVPSSSAVSSAVSSGAATSFITAAPTGTVTINGWAVSGQTPSLVTYNIAATGGINTTLERQFAQTLTRSNSIPVTLTITQDLVLNPSGYVEVDGFNNVVDIAYCQLSADTKSSAVAAICREVVLSGSSTYFTTFFTLTGATQVYIASPTANLAGPINSPVVNSVISAIRTISAASGASSVLPAATAIADTAITA